MPYLRYQKTTWDQGCNCYLYHHRYRQTWYVFLLVHGTVYNIRCMYLDQVSLSFRLACSWWSHVSLHLQKKLVVESKHDCDKKCKMAEYSSGFCIPCSSRDQMNIRYVSLYQKFEEKKGIVDNEHKVLDVRSPPPNVMYSL